MSKVAFLAIDMSDEAGWYRILDERKVAFRSPDLVASLLRYARARLLLNGT